MVKKITMSFATICFNMLLLQDHRDDGWRSTSKKKTTIVFAIILIESGFEKAMEKRMKKIQVRAMTAYLTCCHAKISTQGMVAKLAQVLYIFIHRCVKK